MTELNIYQNRPNPTEPMLNVSVEWVTQITENRSGKENRIPKITEPQYTIEGSDFVLRDDDYDVFVDAFLDAEGKNNAFPFKCPLDYYCAIGEVYDTNSFQRGILVPIDSLNYQIVKQYSVGGISTYKTILLPVDETIHVYEGDTEVFPSVNLSTGVVTFVSPPTGSLKIECEFRLPMRFDVDDNQLNQIKRAVNSIYSANDTSIYLAVNFRLVEDMNYTRKSPLSSSDWQNNLTYSFDGNPLADVAYSERSLTRIQSSDNKRELRDGLGVFRKKYAIANNNMDWNKTQKYFNLFMACKGRLLPFTFEGSLVRLDSDIFSVSMIGYNNVFLDNEQFSFCSPKTVNFSDPLTTEWDIVSALNTGIYAGANYDVDTSGGFWRTTLTYGNGLPGGGYSASIEWGLGWFYTPSHENEIINISFSADLRFVSHSTGGGVFPFTLIASQGGSVVTIQLNSGTNGTWANYNGSANFSSFVAGIPIVLTISRNNSTFPDPNSPVTTVIDARNVAVIVDVTCA